MQLSVCPHCSTALAPGTTACEVCRGTFDEARRVDVYAFGELPRRACPVCGRSAPDFVTVCPNCLAHLDPSSPQPPPLPPQHQLLLDTRSFETSELVALTAAPPTLPSAAQLGRTGQVVHDQRETSTPHTDGALWTAKVWASSPLGERHRSLHTSEQFGLEVHEGQELTLWVERSAAALALPDALRDRREDGQGFVGVQGTCSHEGAIDWLLQLRLLQAVAPDNAVFIDLSAEQEVDPVALEDAAPPLEALYGVHVRREGGLAWIRTAGLARLGSYELEVLEVPAVAIPAVLEVVRAAARRFVEAPLPGPRSGFEVPGGPDLCWLPYAHARADLPRGLPGTTRADRALVRHPSALLFASVAGERRPLAAALAPPPAPAPTAPAPAPEAPTDPPPPPPPRPLVQDLPLPPGALALLSLLLPGAAQMMLGQGGKGALLLAASVLLCGLGGVLNVVCAVDAWLLARRLTRGEVLSPWQFF
ncbi:MAG: zinc ribbon domain-containing protein [Alphaproteobacteria bacterium]|nr:zinc ribbon domain-containing protein [Alphaproteobacteria bacterium]